MRNKTQIFRLQIETEKGAAQRYVVVCHQANVVDVSQVLYTRIFLSVKVEEEALGEKGRRFRSLRNTVANIGSGSVAGPLLKTIQKQLKKAVTINPHCESFSEQIVVDEFVERDEVEISHKVITVLKSAT